MTFFLRLFPAYRWLEMQWRDATHANITKADEIRRLHAAVDKATTERDAARAETIQILREHADFIAYQTTRRTIHGTKVQADAEEPIAEPTPARGVQGREMQARGYQQYIEDAMKFFDGELN